MSKSRIGVYGGTFDPIHNGHLEVADAIIAAFGMERMLFVPAFVPPHKRKQEISSAFHRLSMLALATADRPQMFVSTIELESPSQPFTVETLGRLQQEWNDARLFFVMGADSFRDITMWREYEKILNGYNCIVATRPGVVISAQDTAAHLARHLQAKVVDLRGNYRPLTEIPVSPRIYLTDYVSVDVSATGVREIVACGNSIAGMVPPAVAAYIEKYRLYKNS